MDTRTGEIHELRPGESLKDLAQRLQGSTSDFVPVTHAPSGACKKCHGTGAVRRGLRSKRFKPCECTRS